MMRGLAVLGIFIFVIFTTFSSAIAKGRFGTIKIGQWTGGAYTDDKTGGFTHCAAGAPYLSGIHLIISQNTQGRWTLGFASTTFNFAAGQIIPFDVIFDGQTNVRLFGAAPAPQLLAAPIGNIATVKKSHLMVAEINGTTYQFQLQAVDHVISSVEQCLSKTKVSGIANAGDFSAVAKSVAQTTAPPKAPAPPKASKTIERTGTGFIVSTSGHVITNYHVIDGCVGDINANLARSSALQLKNCFDGRNQ
jgi:hypothetical protein